MLKYYPTQYSYQRQFAYYHFSQWSIVNAFPRAEVALEGAFEAALRDQSALEVEALMDVRLLPMKASTLARYTPYMTW